jgi:C_GCAxxG_C_C family probable redox protein
MNNRVKKASELYGGGLYCSQAVLGAFCEEYGLDEPLAFRISFGLNSGCRCADVCGAVSGAILVIGLKYGNDKTVCNLKTEEYIKIFKERNGSIICRDLLGCDISTPDGKEKAITKNLFKTRCVDMVIDAAQILDDLEY